MEPAGLIRFAKSSCGDAPQPTTPSDNPSPHYLITLRRAMDVWTAVSACRRARYATVRFDRQRWVLLFEAGCWEHVRRRYSFFHYMAG